MASTKEESLRRGFDLVKIDLLCTPEEKLQAFLLYLIGSLSLAREEAQDQTMKNDSTKSYPESGGVGL